VIPSFASPSMSQPLDRPDAIAFFTALKRRESPLAFWSIDRTNNEEVSVEGYVTSVNETLLEIESLQDNPTFIVIAGVQFVRLELDEVPPRIRALAKASYDFVLGFQAGKFTCCAMTKDLRDTAATE
jgi:hypothetical protein